VVYAPKIPTGITSLEELRQFLDEELRSIALEMGKVGVMQMDMQFVAPAKPREGMVLYADGTSFNPGAGRGLYEYRAGVWQKL
jgi:hypothetical protein